MKSRLTFSRGDLVVALAPIIAILLALIAGGVLLLILGADPIRAYGTMIDGAFGSQASLLRTLTRATPLLIIAVGICIAFRAGVINIGAEGQVFVGAIVAVSFSLGLGATLPAWLLAPLTLIVGFLAGAFWGAIPGYLKARFDVNEILSTVMMNEIAVQLLLYLLSGPLIDPKQIEAGTRIPQSAQIPQERGWGDSHRRHKFTSACLSGWRWRWSFICCSGGRRSATAFARSGRTKTPRATRASRCRAT